MHEKVREFWSFVGEYVKQPLDTSLTAMRIDIEQMIATGSKSERQAAEANLKGHNVLTIRYCGQKLLTLEETGKAFKVTRERARQLEKRGLDLLRQYPAVARLLDTDVLGDCEKQLEARYANPP